MNKLMVMMRASIPVGMISLIVADDTQAGATLQGSLKPLHVHGEPTKCYRYSA